MIFFSGEVVKDGIGLQERGVERRRLTIVRLQAKLTIREVRFLGIERT